MVSVRVNAEEISKKVLASKQVESRKQKEDATHQHSVKLSFRRPKSRDTIVRGSSDESTRRVEVDRTGCVEGEVSSARVVRRNATSEKKRLKTHVISFLSVTGRCLQIVGLSSIDQPSGSVEPEAPGGWNSQSRTVASPALKKEERTTISSLSPSSFVSHSPRQQSKELELTQ